jgi:hypothetical protein
MQEKLGRGERERGASGGKGGGRERSNGSIDEKKREGKVERREA